MPTAGDFHRLWLAGQNTAEIAQAFDLPEYEVDQRLARMRDGLRQGRITAERRRKARQARAERESPKLGFTGRDTVSGTPRRRG